MKSITHTMLAAIGALALAQPALAQQVDPVRIERVPDRDSVIIDPAKAYLLVEGSGVLLATFLLAPTEEQRAEWSRQRAAALQEAIDRYPRLLERYRRDKETWDRIAARGVRPSGREPVEPVMPAEDNFSWPELEPRMTVLIGPFNRFSSNEGASLWLYEVPAGTYTYYSQGSAAAGLGDCMCMGTVRFDVPVGRITAVRIGTQWLDREGGPADERPEVENSNDMFARMGAYVDPPSDAALDPRLPRELIRSPEFVLVERLPNWFGGTVNRIQPSPGLFHYERGRMVDERSGN